jgi:hypothetical protein
MHPSFRVQVSEVATVRKIRDGWPEGAQRALLAELMDEDLGLAGAELEEMVSLALQDLDPVGCGVLLLRFVLGDAMSNGMREDVARAMLERKPWEQHSQMVWHRGIFEAAVMLKAAHGRAVTTPTATRVTLGVRALDDAARALLAAPPSPALAARLAAPCLRSGILTRLFEDGLAGARFPEAPSVVWTATFEPAQTDEVALVIEGGDVWWSAAEPGPAVDVRAWTDAFEAQG